MTEFEHGLGRLPEFDERSRNFPITAHPLVAGVGPRSYTWACGVNLDQGREGACFPAGTMVRLANGSQRAIEEVMLLDDVVTAEGHARPVLQTMVRWHAGNVVNVKLRGHHPVQCTPEHPFLTERGYVPAHQLTRDDYVAVTRYRPPEDDIIDVSALVDVRDLRGIIEGVVNAGGALTKVAALPSILVKTPALGRLIGLYAAEGCTTANKVTWSFGGHERDTFVAETVALVKTAFDAEARLQVRSSGAINVVLYGKTWRRLFEALVPGTSKHGDKHLSHHVTSGPRPFLEGVLAGWLDGDGHARRTSIEGITVCHRLALDMHAIANDLGRFPSIHVSEPSANRHAATRQKRWSVTLPTGDGLNLPRLLPEATWRKVATAEQEPFTGYVFNLHVAGDESYVAEGLGVHNCVGFSWAQEMAAKPVVVQQVANATGQAIYRRAQQLDEWEGEYPAYEGTSVLAGAKAVAELGRLVEYHWAFGVDDLARGVSRAGPAVIGINWWSDMYNPGADGYVRPTGYVMGGHAILVRGYSVSKRRFLLHNSWGLHFGGKGGAPPGCAWIDHDDLGGLLQAGGDACIPVRRA